MQEARDREAVVQMYVPLESSHVWWRLRITVPPHLAKDPGDTHGASTITASLVSSARHSQQPSQELSGGSTL